MADFLPAAQGAFAAKANLIVTTVAGSPSTYGQTAGAMTSVSAELAAYLTAESVVEGNKAALKSSVEDRDIKRANLETSLRDINRSAQALPASPEELAVAGLPVHDTSRTPGAAPTERAEVRVQVIGQEHRLTIVNLDTLRPARPADARQIELYRAIVPAGDPLPFGVDQMTLIGTYTSSRVTLQYTSAEIGKTIVYLARYVGSKNQAGPAGTTTAASVAA